MCSIRDAIVTYSELKCIIQIWMEFYLLIFPNTKDSIVWNGTGRESLATRVDTFAWEIHCQKSIGNCSVADQAWRRGTFHSMLIIIMSLIAMIVFVFIFNSLLDVPPKKWLRKADESETETSPEFRWWARFGKMCFGTVMQIEHQYQNFKKIKQKWFFSATICENCATYSVTCCTN